MKLYGFIFYTLALQSQAFSFVFRHVIKKIPLRHKFFWQISFVCVFKRHTKLTRHSSTDHRMHLYPLISFAPRSN